MIKSILIALDESPSSIVAKKLGVQLAQFYKAHLSGIGIIDEPWILSPEPIPLGGAAFKMEINEQLISDAKHRVHKLEKAFLDFCKNHEIPSSIIDVAGVPSYEIESFLVEYDLLIIGKDASFHLNISEDTPIPVRQLIKDNPRPLIVVGTDAPPINQSDILVAFDGTFAASRALHMSILLDLFKEKSVHIVSVNPDENVVRNWINSAAKLCHNHGIHVHLHPLVTPEKPGEAILKLINGIDPALLVLGSYGHGELNHFLWGSCAEELLKSTNLPIFFFH